MVIQSELRVAASASKSRRKLRRLGVFDLPPRTSGNALLRTLLHTGPLLCRIASGEVLGFSELRRRPKTGSPTSVNTSCPSFEDVGASCTSVGAQRGRLEFSSPPESSAGGGRHAKAGTSLSSSSRRSAGTPPSIEA